MNERLLIAVKSCLRDLDRGHHEIIRQTWGQDVSPADLRFFLGGKEGISRLKADEKVMAVADDYYSLPHKTREILRWSVYLDYDFTYLCDTDTFTIPRKLLTCGFQNFDYSGSFIPVTDVKAELNWREDKDRPDGGLGIRKWNHPYTNGGLGFFVSKKAAEFIIFSEPASWAEDRSVGQNLGPYIQQNVIKGRHLSGFEKRISWHFPTEVYGVKQGGYDPKFGWMQKMHYLHGENK